MKKQRVAKKKRGEEEEGEIKMEGLNGSYVDGRSTLEND